MSKRQQAAVDHAIQRAMVKRDHRWTRRWLAIATVATFVGNVGHHYDTAIRQTHGQPDAWFWFGTAWAAVPPTMLMLAVHAVPVIHRLLGTTDRDHVLNAVAWMVTTAALIWSGFGIWSVTVALGVHPVVAPLAPLAIDLSVFGATRALVQAAPRVAAEQLAARESEHADARPSVKERVRAPRVTEDKRAQTHASSQVNVARDSDDREDVRADAPVGARPEHHDRARALVDARRTQANAETVARALAMLDAQVSRTAVAEATGLHRDAVRRLAQADAELVAVAELNPERQLSAV